MRSISSTALARSALAKVVSAWCCARLVVNARRAIGRLLRPTSVYFLPRYFPHLWRISHDEVCCYFGSELLWFGLLFKFGDGLWRDVLLVLCKLLLNEHEHERP